MVVGLGGGDLVNFVVLEQEQESEQHGHLRRRCLVSGKQSEGFDGGSVRGILTRRKAQYSMGARTGGQEKPLVTCKSWCGKREVLR